MMKKTVSFLTLVILAAASFGQNKERLNAYNYNNNQQYDKAKEAIDKAILHEKTMDDPKTWRYRADIYFNIYNSEDPEVQALSDDALGEAYKSWQKVFELDEKGQYEKEGKEWMIVISDRYYQRAAAHYNEQNYQWAAEDFATSYEIGSEGGRVDTAATFNVGMAAFFANDADLAIEYLKMARELQYDDPYIFIYESKAYKMKEDTAAALEVLKEGSQVYPESMDLLKEQAQIYLETGQTEKLQESLLIAIESEPENTSLLFLLGKTYDDSGDFENAITYYNKACEVNPEFFEAWYNAGAMYFNRGAGILNEANNLPLSETAKYEEMQAQAFKEFELAIPYLEKALEIMPEDTGTRNTLIDVYKRMGKLDKAKALQDG